MATVPAPDVDLLDALDFELPCDVRIAMDGRVSDRCTRPAAWTYRCTNCGLAGLLCNGHRDAIFGRPVIKCLKCGTVGDPDVLIVIEPLGRKS